jgi:hypothetical protein
MGGNPTFMKGVRVPSISRFVGESKEAMQVTLRRVMPNNQAQMPPMSSSAALSLFPADA